MEAQPVIRVFPVAVGEDRRGYIFEVRLATDTGREVLVKQGERAFIRPATADEQGRRWLHSAAGRRATHVELADMRRCGEVL
jgi:hypothetical protein